MRGMIAILFLVGCGGRASTGPAWPKSAGTVEPEPDAVDGGESIDPRTPAVAAVEKSSSPESDAKPDDKPADAKPDAKPADAKPDDKPAATSISPEEPIFEEIIVIDISD